MMFGWLGCTSCRREKAGLEGLSGHERGIESQSMSISHESSTSTYRCSGNMGVKAEVGSCSEWFVAWDGEEWSWEHRDISCVCRSASDCSLLEPQWTSTSPSKLGWAVIRCLVNPPLLRNLCSQPAGQQKCEGLWIVCFICWKNWLGAICVVKEEILAKIPW